MRGRWWRYPLTTSTCRAHLARQASNGGQAQPAPVVCDMAKYKEWLGDPDTGNGNRLTTYNSLCKIALSLWYVTFSRCRPVPTFSLHNKTTNRCWIPTA